MKASIIVCTLHSKNLKDCLKSLKKQTFKDFEILVVTPNPNVKKISEEFGARFILSQLAGVSYQRNLGIRYARGEIICFIDDDAVADERWLEFLVKNFKEKVGCVGGKIKLWFEGEINKELKKIDEGLFKRFLGGTTLGNKKIELKEPLLWGSNLAVKKEIFEKVGFFDELIGKKGEIELYNEEIELQERILRKGYKLIYEPKAIVWHKVPTKKLNLEHFLRRAFWQGYSDVLAFRKEKTVKEMVKKMEEGNFYFLLKRKIFEEIVEMLLEKNPTQKILRCLKIGRGMGLLDLKRWVNARAK